MFFLKFINFKIKKINSNVTTLNLNETKIMWSPNSTQKPDGTKWSKNFKIVTIEEKPFIFKIENKNKKECSNIKKNSINCTHVYGKRIG